MTVGNSSFLFTQLFDNRNKLDLTTVADNGEIGVIEIPIDATISEQHTLNSQITKNAIESGSKVGDHIHNDPIELSMTCTITDSPVRFLAGLTSRGVKPTQNAWEMLKQLRDAKTPFTVVTGLQTYENMAIASLGVPVDADTGNQLVFTLDLEEVPIVTSETVFLSPAEKDTGQATADKGTQSPAPPPAAQTEKVNQSWAKALF
jgi:hypothetical protein